MRRSASCDVVKHPPPSTWEEQSPHYVHVHVVRPSSPLARERRTGHGPGVEAASRQKTSPPCSTRSGERRRRRVRARAEDEVGQQALEDEERVVVHAVDAPGVGEGNHRRQRRRRRRVAVGAADSPRHQGKSLINHHRRDERKRRA